MNQSVVVLNLPGNFVREDCCLHYDRDRRTPPIILLQMATELKEYCDVTFLDANVGNLSFEDIKKFLEKSRPELVITSILYWVKEDMRIIDICNSLGIKLVVAPMPFEYAHVLAEHNPKIHYVFDSPPNIVEEMPFNYDLLPDFDLYNSFIYQVSRGCPYNCIFCMWAGKKFQLKPVKTVIRDLNELHKHGVKKIFLLCSHITNNVSWLKEFCYEKIRSKNPIMWHSDVLSSDLTNELAALMRQAGCYGLFMGLESPIPSKLKYLKKPIKPSDVARAVNICFEEGIIPKTSLIFNIEETEKDLDVYLRFLDHPLVRRTTLKAVNLFLIPGTQAHRMIKNYVNTNLLHRFKRQYKKRKPLHIFLRILWVISNRNALTNMIMVLKTRNIDFYKQYLIHLLGISS